MTGERSERRHSGRRRRRRVGDQPAELDDGLVGPTWNPPIHHKPRANGTAAPIVQEWHK